MSDNTFEVNWCIENATAWFETRDDALLSPQFKAGTLKNTRWRLRLSPNWQLGEKYISLSLQRDIEDDYPQTINLNCELLFIASDGSLLKSKRCTDAFGPKTVGQVLNVKQSVILEEQREEYLPKGVLTICCRLSKGSTVSYGAICLVQTVIGKKSIKANATIDNLTPPSIMTVNFIPPSTEDISFISLEVYVGSDELIFKRKHVEYKNFSWYLCKLFALGSNGEEIGFKERSDLTNQLVLNNAETIETMSLDQLIRNGTLSLQLDLTYYPGVVSESARIMF